jgi:acyl carrier protein
MVHDRRSVREGLKVLLVETLELDVDPREIGDEEPLFEAGLGVDSMEALALLQAVEARFRVRIPDSEIGLSSFHDIEALAALVERTLAQEEAERR